MMKIKLNIILVKIVSTILIKFSIMIIFFKMNYVSSTNTVTTNLSLLKVMICSDIFLPIYCSTFVFL